MYFSSMYMDKTSLNLLKCNSNLENICNLYCTCSAILIQDFGCFCKTLKIRWDKCLGKLLNWLIKITDV